LRNSPVQFFLALFLLFSVPVALLLALRYDWPELAAWLLAANVAALPLWIYDRHQSRQGGWRVPERTLHAMAFVGASPASLLAMAVLRHKTQKRHFWVLYVTLLVLQIAALGYWLGSRRPPV